MGGGRGAAAGRRPAVGGRLFPVRGVDNLLEIGGELREFGGGGEGVVGALGGALGGGRDAGDILGDFVGPEGGLGGVASDLVGGGGLFLHGAGNGVLNVVDARDDLGDLADGGDGALGVSLDRFDLGGDIRGGGGGLLGEFLDLIGDDREALARLAGAGGLNGGVEGEEVGLLRDRGDDLDDLADFGAALSSRQ